MTDWITVIPLTEWPQQNVSGGELKPAMQHELDWHGFGAFALPLMRQVFPDHNRIKMSPMLSVVMPGHDIKPHRDLFGPNWESRVHIPLVTNLASKFIIDGEEYQMLAGTAYRVNISREHSVTNNGAIPRIHFMFDCYATGA